MSAHAIRPSACTHLSRNAQDPIRQAVIETLEQRRLLSATVTGSVYHDLDADGVRDSNEPGLEYWRISFTAQDGSGATIYTNGSGAYATQELAASDYTVAGYPRDYSAPRATATVTLQDGDNQVDLGYVGPSGVVAGRVYDDANGNGLFDAGESGFAGITVFIDLDGDRVFDASETSQVTDAEGRYELTAPTEHPTLTVAVPQGWRQSSYEARGVYVNERTPIWEGVDFALTQTSAVYVTVWDDLNGDGNFSFDPWSGMPEPLLEDAILFIDADLDGVRDAGEAIPMHEGGAAYIFTGLLPGTYRIAQAPIDDYQITHPAVGYVDVTIGTAESESLFFANRFTGSEGPTTVSGVIHHDVNGNFWKDEGETGLVGVTVFLDGNRNGVLDGNELSTVSGADGQYVFDATALARSAPGTYVVRAVPQEGWAPGRPYGVTINLAYRDSVTGVDLFVQPAGSGDRTITGTVFRDANNNGFMDEGEAPVAGSKVFVDANLNIVRDLNEPYLTTASDGTFSLDGLFAGYYQVYAVSPYHDSIYMNGAPADVTSDATADVQLAVPAGTVVGHVYFDANVNGIFDDGDSAIEGATVYWDVDFSGTFNDYDFSTVTAADGSYMLDHFATGATYQFGVVSTYLPANPANGLHQYTFVNGETVQLDFGLSDTVTVPNRIEGRVFNDLDGDGIQQENEVGRAGLVVYDDSNFSGSRDEWESYTLTDANGDYVLDGVTNQGAWLVVTNDQFFYSIGGAFIWGNPAVTRQLNIALAPATLGVGAYTDVNEDGAFTDGIDTPLENAIIYIDVNESGTLDDGDTSITTGADGFARFTEAPGYYMIGAILPSGTQIAPGGPFIFYNGSSYDAMVFAEVRPLSVTAPADQTLDEGQAALFDLGSFTDSDVAGPWTVTVDWADGSDQSQFEVTTPGEIQFEHFYGSRGFYTVNVTVTNANGVNRSATFNITVNNILHTPAITGPITGTEASPFTLIGTATDPGTWDTITGFHFVWDVYRNGELVHHQVEPGYASQSALSYTPADSGTYEAVLSVMDGDGNWVTANHTVTVANVAPTVAITNVPAAATEGGSYLLGSAVSDPSGIDHAAGYTYSWSLIRHNVVIQTGSASSFTFAPTDDGPYTVSLTATDKDGGSTTTSVTINVANLAPTATFAQVGTANEGSAATVGFTGATDSAVDSAIGFRYSYDFNNDGDFTDPGDLLNVTSSSASFAFADNGTYTVRGRITDKDGAFTDYTTTVVVNNVAPTVTISGPTTAKRNKAASFTFSTTDPSSADRTAGYTYAIDWDGNGTVDQTLTGGSPLTRSYTYKKAGTYTIKVFVTDKDGATSTATWTIRVS